jgi:hypothetical protein
MLASIPLTKGDSKHRPCRLTLHLPAAGERNVQKYQVYSITEDGSVTGNREIEAASDDEAIFTVRAMQRPHHTEIWYRDRRVAKVAPHSRLS